TIVHGGTVYPKTKLAPVGPHRRIELAVTWTAAVLGTDGREVVTPEPMPGTFVVKLPESDLPRFLSRLDAAVPRLGPQAGGSPSAPSSEPGGTPLPSRLPPGLATGTGLDGGVVVELGGAAVLLPRARELVGEALGELGRTSGVGITAPHERQILLWLDAHVSPSALLAQQQALVQSGVRGRQLELHLADGRFVTLSVETTARIVPATLRSVAGLPNAKREFGTEEWFLAIGSEAHRQTTVTNRTIGPSGNVTDDGEDWSAPDASHAQVTVESTARAQTLGQGVWRGKDHILGIDGATDGFEGDVQYEVTVRADLRPQTHRPLGTAWNTLTGGRYVAGKPVSVTKVTRAPGRVTVQVPHQLVSVAAAVVPGSVPVARPPEEPRRVTAALHPHAQVIETRASDVAHDLIHQVLRQAGLSAVDIGQLVDDLGAGLDPETMRTRLRPLLAHGLRLDVGPVGSRLGSLSVSFALLATEGTPAGGAEPGPVSLSLSVEDQGWAITESTTNERAVTTTATRSGGRVKFPVGVELPGTVNRSSTTNEGRTVSTPGLALDNTGRRAEWAAAPWTPRVLGLAVEVRFDADRRRGHRSTQASRLLDSAVTLVEPPPDHPLVVGERPGLWMPSDLAGDPADDARAVVERVVGNGVVLDPERGTGGLALQHEIAAFLRTHAPGYVRGGLMPPTVSTLLDDPAGLMAAVLSGAVWIPLPPLATGGFVPLLANVRPAWLRISAVPRAPIQLPELTIPAGSLVSQVHTQRIESRFTDNVTSTQGRELGGSAGLGFGWGKNSVRVVGQATKTDEYTTGADRSAIEGDWMAVSHDGPHDVWDVPVDYTIELVTDSLGADTAATLGNLRNGARTAMDDARIASHDLGRQLASWLPGRNPARRRRDLPAAPPVDARSPQILVVHRFAAPRALTRLPVASDGARIVPADEPFRPLLPGLDAVRGGLIVVDSLNPTAMRSLQQEVLAALTRRDGPLRRWLTRSPSARLPVEQVLGEAFLAGHASHWLTG
ncbi:MAG: hypothetical protein ACRCZD_00675, partial [Phycicoccus sp.]